MAVSGKCCLYSLVGPNFLSLVLRMSPSSWYRDGVFPMGDDWDRGQGTGGQSDLPSSADLWVVNMRCGVLGCSILNPSGASEQFAAVLGTGDTPDGGSSFSPPPLQRQHGAKCHCPVTDIPCEQEVHFCLKSLRSGDACYCSKSQPPRHRQFP